MLTTVTIEPIDNGFLLCYYLKNSQSRFFFFDLDDVFDFIKENL